jgi:hypothetical protein
MDRPHAGEAAESAAMGEPHEHGFGLVVEVMRGEEQRCAIRPHRPADQPVSRRSRRGLDAGGRLRPLPAQDAGFDAEARGTFGGEPRFVRRFRSKAMVDSIDDQSWRGARRRPMLREQQQRQTVGATGNRQANRRMATRRLEQHRRGSVELGGRAQPLHFAFDISCLSLPLKAPDVSAYFVDTRLKVLHAASFWSAPASAIPSLSSMSGARGELGYFL